MTGRTIARLVLLGIAASVHARLAPAAVVWQPVSSPLPVWMAGCWTGERAGERFDERWVVADNATLLAVAHTTKNGTMTAFEFLRVVARNGTAVFVAQPGGAPPTEFGATTMTATRVVFENPAHDFPKRVTYERLGADRLTASVDGGVASGQRLEFAMSRSACAQ